MQEASNNIVGAATGTSPRRQRSWLRFKPENIGLGKLAAGLFLIAAFFAGALTSEVHAGPPRQDPARLRTAIEKFIRTQTVGLPGEVGIAVSQLDPRLALADCSAPQVFLPSGSRAWGKTTVGVKCDGPASWAIYVQVRVAVTAEFVVSAGPLSQGRTIVATDLRSISGDLTEMPAGVITTASQAVGRTLTMSLAAGMPLRQDILKSQLVVRQGQSVRVVSSGPGFQVAAEGRALANAADGEPAEARIASGQVVSGTAKSGGSIEVAY